MSWRGLNEDKPNEASERNYDTDYEASSRQALSTVNLRLSVGVSEG